MMKALLLLLFSTTAMAQTYDVSLSLDGNTYAGQFTYVPTYDVNPGGQTVQLGYYTNVSLSDVYAGTLTSVLDPYDGNNLQQHELWFNNAQNMPIGINIPDTGIKGSSVAVTGAMVYFGKGAGDYVSCTVCVGSITEAVSEVIRQAPEIDASNISSAATLLVGSLLVWGRRKTQRALCKSDGIDIADR
jgi:hypothetical protein